MGQAWAFGPVARSYGEKMLKATHKVLQLGVALLVFPYGLQSVANAQPPADPRRAQAAANKALVRQWIEEGFNERNVQIVDDIFVQSVRINGQPIAREDLKRNMTLRIAAFPDLRITIDAIVGEENRVGIWYTAEGTHRGEFEGIPPSGTRVKWAGADLFQLDAGRIAQATFLDDSLGLLRQLGATVSPPAD
jgi:steroid delta-isomerase-like uncharacterized protein